MSGRVLLKAITEIDGRLVQDEVYVELGQSVVPMVKDGKLSLTVKCDTAAQPAKLSILDERPKTAEPIRWSVSGNPGLGEPVTITITENPPARMDRLAEAVEKWLPTAVDLETDSHWLSATRGKRVEVNPTQKLPAKLLGVRSDGTVEWMASKAAAKSAKTQTEWLRELIRKQVAKSIGSGAADVTVAAKAGAPSPMPVPRVLKVLFDGYPLPHVVACSVAEGWVDVLLHSEDGEPIWDASRQAWKAERIHGRVQRIEDKP